MIEAEAQANEYTERLEQMQKTLAIVEKEKDDTIRRLLGKLHRSDNDRADAVMTPFFIGGSVLCATNNAVRSIFGQAMLCSFCSPETQNFQKNNSFSFF